MPEWKHLFPHDVDVVLSILTIRFAAAFVMGCFVAAVYYFTQGKPPGQSVPMMATLVLLTVLIAMVTLTIGESLARAFSLAGALAIIRFRTVVEDTRDTAFVIFAVAEGMAFGAGFMILPLLGAPFVAEIGRVHV